METMRVNRTVDVENNAALESKIQEAEAKLQERRDQLASKEDAFSEMPSDQDFQLMRDENLALFDAEFAEQDAVAAEYDRKLAA
jgi:hypothetical protein